MNYDATLHAFVFDELPDGLVLGLNETEPLVKNVECIDLGGEVKYLLTETPAEVLWEGENA
jgi:hypothetical protein